MEIPAEFSGRVCKTGFRGAFRTTKRLEEIQKDWPGSEIDIMYEKYNGELTARYVLVFESSEDCLAYKLKYGEDYV